jgi:predicted DCC family thiol-disulfide oxidoreductase YuxK
VKHESLTIFYDGYCPLCVKEMRHLKKLDASQKLDLVDVNDAEFTENFPEISQQDALTRLHGYWYQSAPQLSEENGSEEKQLVTGLDVTYHAWRMVGKGWIIAPLRWPGIRWFSDRLYLWFARHRFTISEWLTGQPRCERCKLPLE